LEKPKGTKLKYIRTSVSNRPKGAFYSDINRAANWYKRFNPCNFLIIEDKNVEG
jgi:hypothetical protein